jgi:hypothetical protein
MSSNLSGIEVPQEIGTGLSGGIRGGTSSGRLHGEIVEQRSRALPSIVVPSLAAAGASLAVGLGIAAKRRRARRIGRMTSFAVGLVSAIGGSVVLSLLARNAFGRPDIVAEDGEMGAAEARLE